MSDGFGSKRRAFQNHCFFGGNMWEHLVCSLANSVFRYSDHIVFSWVVVSSVSNTTESRRY